MRMGQKWGSVLEKKHLVRINVQVKSPPGNLFVLKRVCDRKINEIILAVKPRAETRIDCGAQLCVKLDRKKNKLFFFIILWIHIIILL